MRDVHSNQFNRIVDDKSVDLVLLTIGGNDLGFAEVAHQCLAFEDQEDGCSKSLDIALRYLGDDDQSAPVGGFIPDFDGSYSDSLTRMLELIGNELHSCDEVRTQAGQDQREPPEWLDYIETALRVLPLPAGAVDKPADGWFDQKADRPAGSCVHCGQTGSVGSSDAGASAPAEVLPR
jgi:hypothetical protein